MKILYNSLICLIVALSLHSCYDDENLNEPDKGVPYPIEDSSDPLDHEVYEVYNKYHSIVRYVYSDTEVNWNMIKASLADNNSFRVTRQEDRDVLLKGVKFVEDVFLKVYEGKLPKNWMPFKILLAENIDLNDEFMGWLPNKPAASGLNFLMVGNIKDGIDALSDEEKQKAKEAIHGRYWGNYLYGNERIDVPYQFFEVSKDKYDWETEDCFADGFWGLNEDYSAWGNYCPNKELDIQQFFGKIVSTPYSELKPILDANEKLKLKYDILVTYVMSEFGIDIQAIGNGEL